MAKDKHVHFILSPDNPREKKIIELLAKLPNRQEKSFIVSLIEGQAQMARMAVEVHALAAHFGLAPVEVDLEGESTSMPKAPAQAAEQMPGQVSVYDVVQTPAAARPVRESKPKPACAGGHDSGQDDMPEAVLGFMGSLNNWGDDE